jgi:zinc transporter 1
MGAEDTSSLHTDHRRKRLFLKTKTFRLLSMLSLTFLFFGVELVVGNITNSVALIADAFHMLSDVIALVIAIVAVRIARRRSDINTFGWVRAEVVGANINTVFLLALCLTIVFDAIRRYIQPEPIVNVNLLLIVGSIGLGINIIGLFLFQGFHGHSHGGMSHGHSHGGSSHEQVHGKKSKEQSHDEKSHGHSHDEESHGHSHDENSHGHSHDHNSHGHSHEHSNTKSNENVEMEDINEESGNGRDFKRYSSRALEEVRFK